MRRCGRSGCRATQLVARPVPTMALREESYVSKLVTMQLTEDEAEIIVDAFETDLEGYVEAAKDARANRNHTDVATFTEASNRIAVVLEKMRAALA